LCFFDNFNRINGFFSRLSNSWASHVCLSALQNCYATRVFPNTFKWSPFNTFPSKFLYVFYVSPT
jgi:hypothetical protein